MTSLTEEQLADRHLTFEDLRETEGWKLLETRLEELESKFELEIGRAVIRASKHTDKPSILDVMLKTNQETAYKRGIIRGMRYIVHEPERIKDDFNKAFEEKMNG